MRVMLVLAAALALVACKKDGEKAAVKPADTTAPAVAKPAADGVRTIAIEANEKGYVPDKIPGKPNEKLKLVFTRTIEAECLAQVKAPDGKLYDLPMNSPVEVAVTVPATGKLTFACGMNMFEGQIVADVN